ncbi:hypothetical protein M899_1649 [Bacteriovorax sp. BSW11_IV]|nr:hypothetical protein M899_1649 [Bacteriovorax sp. BSW11_IV]
MFSMNREESIKRLVELGKAGFYPLFDDSWFFELAKNNTPLNAKQQEKAKSLIKRLGQHRSLERQKTVLFSMPEEDRNIIMKTFLKLVEGSILDEAPQLH